LLIILQFYQLANLDKMLLLYYYFVYETQQDRKAHSAKNNGMATRNIVSPRDIGTRISGMDRQVSFTKIRISLWR